jgi:hypothetical protein
VSVIVQSLEVSADDLEARTGWAIRPEGACKADRCVPLPGNAGDAVDVNLLAERLGMELVHDAAHGLWALGPEAGERALMSAELPDITLPDRHGNPFSLSALHGKKVLLVAWASW